MKVYLPAYSCVSGNRMLQRLLKYSTHISEETLYGT